MIVKSIERTDIGNCVELGKLLHNESPYYGRSEFNESKLYRLAELCINDPNYCCFVAQDNDDNIIGMIAGVIGTHFFSDCKYSTDITFFVRPESRGSTAALRLLTAFCIWSEAMGCDEIRCGVSTGIRIDAADRIYKKFGFKEEGRLYVMVPSKDKLVH